MAGPFVLRKHFDERADWIGLWGLKGMNESKRSVTIRDVAERAKVSISTVSHVVNKTRRVEDATRDRILSAINELEYRPNQLARGLRGAETATIGLIISDIREEFFRGDHQGHRVGGQRKGLYGGALRFRGGCRQGRPLSRDTRRERRRRDHHRPRRFDCPPASPSRQETPHGADRPPLCGLGPRFRGDRQQKACRCGRAAFPFRRHRRDRLRRPRDAASGRWASGPRASPSRCASSGTRTEDADSPFPRKATIPRPSSSVGSRPISISRPSSAETPISATWCSRRSTKWAWPIPRPISLATFDDLICFRYMRHPVITIRQPTEKMGLAALDMLMQRIKGGGPRHLAK